MTGWAASNQCCNRNVFDRTSGTTCGRESQSPSLQRAAIYDGTTEIVIQCLTQLALRLTKLASCVAPGVIGIIVLSRKLHLYFVGRKCDLAFSDRGMLGKILSKPDSFVEGMLVTPP